MLIQRCAWHAFFRGYPRPLRVLSWRGRGVTFTETICPSCADRVRIEGLWGSPPPPVWPGSAYTALLFVGLPLLTALILLAAPLHDSMPPRLPADIAALPAGEPAMLELSGARPPFASIPMPRVGATPQDRGGPVPAATYETRRAIHRVPESSRLTARTWTEATAPDAGARTAGAATFSQQSP